MRKTPFKYIIISFLYGTILLFHSCLKPMQRNLSADNSSDSSTPQNVPKPDPSQDVFSYPNNYFQFGSQSFPNTLTLSNQFSDSFSLRGKAIHDFLSQESKRALDVCFVASFTVNSSNKKILLLSANSTSFTNFSTQKQEFYYFMQSTDKDQNSLECDKISLKSVLQAQYPNYTIVFSVKEVCADCVISFNSTPVKLYYTSGSVLSDISTTNLVLSLSNNVTIDNPASNGCNSDPLLCKTKGYDCCFESENICIKDGSLKQNVDITSTEYLQSLVDIKSNFLNIVNYANLYYICGLSDKKKQKDLGTVIQNPAVKNQQNLEMLTQLYQCTTTQQDELSTCQIEVDQAFKTLQNTSDGQSAIFETLGDDRNFRSTYMGSSEENISKHSIVKVIYGGITLYDKQLGIQNSNVSIDTIGVNNSTNDTLVDKQKILIKKDVLNLKGVVDDKLYIQYQVDGSCVKVNATLASCFKVYIQNQNTNKVSDHLSTNLKYILPYYADTSRLVKVEVDDFLVYPEKDYTLTNNGGDKYIQFIEPNTSNSLGRNIADSQKVKIIFYVNLDQNNPMLAKQIALTTIDKICLGGNTGYLLNPVYRRENGVDKIVNFDCVAPQKESDDTIPPIFLSSKSIPLRFYDATGVAFNSPTVSNGPQEGNAFEYKNFDSTKPNNIGSDIGFNEIYGSVDFKANSAKAPVAVKVKKGQSYDIYVNSGQFSHCLECGHDYYDFIARLFPENLTYKGGGYRPDSVRTNPFALVPGIGEGPHRKDDFLFGRACFVPASMIYWTYDSNSDYATQRKNRLKAQHFLFSNGYGRDWYGFDYGSIIGSFDGTNWFSIGNQRKITAKSNQLFLAVNAYFADQTMESTYQISITKSQDIFNSGPNVSFDNESDGAECQKFHECKIDTDCITQLGYDYSCQNVTNMYTNWPSFDDNGQEIANILKKYKIIDLLSTNLQDSGVKRCVYRGRGAICTAEYDSITSSDTDFSHLYNNSNTLGLHVCSANTYCQKFKENGVSQSTFNSKIARFATSPSIQNENSTIVESVGESDTFGLGSRVIGRPMDWNGKSVVNLEVQSTLTSNNVYSICIPGKNISSDLTLNTQLKSSPGDQFLGDKITGLGMSDSSNTKSAYYLSSCPTVDSTNNYLTMNDKNYRPSKLLSDTTLKNYSATQNLSTNLLKIFEGANNGISLLNSITQSTISEPLYQENRCLRAVGASCFSDFDCGTNEKISTALGVLTRDGYQDIFDPYEFDYWSQELICGNPVPYFSKDFNLKNNKCCRDVGKVFSVPTKNTIFRDTPQADDSKATIVNTNMSSMAGIDINIDNKNRYSGIAPIYKDLKEGTVVPLEIPAHNKCTNNLIGTSCEQLNTNKSRQQYLTLDKLNKSMCCTNNWVRNFHTDQNGGGHRFGPDKAQGFNYENFKCTAFKSGPQNGNAFACSDPKSTSTCKAYNLLQSEIKQFSLFFSSLELIGIPNAIIENPSAVTNDKPTAPNQGAYCFSDPDTQTDLIGHSVTTIPGTVRNLVDNSDSDKTISGDDSILPFQAVPEYVSDYNATDPLKNKYYYSASDQRNFDFDSTSSALKIVFSQDQFSCCLPTGKVYDFEITDEMCCTGMKFPGSSTDPQYCVLPDYANVSVYLNRYVSSEASELSTELFDPLTGRISSTSVVQSLALKKYMCASGKTGLGKSIANLGVPNVDGTNSTDPADKKMRFLFQSNDDNIDYWKNGQRWNLDVYCVPDAK